MTIRICPHTFPLAIKISEVTPISVAASLTILTSPVIIFETVTIRKDIIHNIHSFFVSSLKGFFKTKTPSP